jgi:hypothetical protein
MLTKFKAKFDVRMYVDKYFFFLADMSTPTAFLEEQTGLKVMRPTEYTLNIPTVGLSLAYRWLCFDI